MVEISILLLPLLSSIFSFLSIKRYSFCHQVFASILIFGSAIASWHVMLNFENDYVISLFTWFKVANIQSEWSIHVSRLSSIMFVVVSSISCIIHFYSIGYMHEDKGVARFFCYISLFVFFMMILISAADLFQLFCGWEGVGLCSYLLIGFWFTKDSANQASIKAFIINRIGDFCLLLGIFTIIFKFGSANFDEISYLVNSGHISSQVGCLLIFLGCMGKSAQIGLHVWLPDAMEGPTPVSALIHAATMVNAGVFLLIKLNALFIVSGVNDVVLIIGSCTALLGSLIALVQTDIKKIIAYSTCSQLGYMFIALGSYAYNIALLHLVTHACFKALLFLCAGNIIHAYGQQDIRNMGSLGKKIKLITVFTWIGSLALTGIYPFAGYYSKDLIIEYSHVNHYAHIIALVVVPLTSIYSFKLLFSAFYTDNNKNTSFHPSSNFMTYPLFILAFFSVFAGIICIRYGFLSQNFWGSSMLLRSLQHVSLLDKFTPMIISVLGITVAYLLVNRHRFDRRLFISWLLCVTIFMLINKIIAICFTILTLIFFSLDKNRYGFTILLHILRNKFYFDILYSLIVKHIFLPLCRICKNVDHYIDVLIVILPCRVVSFGQNVAYLSLNKGGKTSKYIIHFLSGVVLYLLSLHLL
ncbi:MAG: NADH dehydrogenase I, L subunit [Candidatus Xenolissoclinum pacificiensis L6]|uniref:NADH-quinone oxidoreductase subunit L n=1 Tax=Candidatus Xenolissoclinum pacificiensis L6 TaxID=1401685 RepID=W2V3B7_9RICK|nr:MAG: NADH dehydrogenase I, L subunit [Candidatus Xenolissoclinum pacificiensis L6]